jgi:molybdenum cofactor sulfurtransferase
MEEHMRIVMAEGHYFGSSSNHLSEHVGDAQGRLLQMFNTSRAEYTVVFTSGFTAACRLVADAYPFQKGSPLLLCQDNHEAVRQVLAFT